MAENRGDRGARGPKDGKGGYRGGRGSSGRADGGNRSGGYRRDSEGGKRGGGYSRGDGDDRRGGYRRDSEGGKRGGGYSRGDGDDRRGGYRRDSEGGKRGGGGERRRGDDRRDGKRYSGGENKGRGGFRGRPDDRGKQSRPRPHQGQFQSEDPNEPVIPAGVLASDLDREAAKALSTLSGFNQEIVSRHLVAAGQTLDVDPELAYQHAQAAVKRAGRVDVVREAAALTAYATGRYDEALREVRAVRRMRGDNSLKAIEADCERGLGRPEKAIEIVEATTMSELPLEEQVELVLVSAGAREDLGQTEYSLMVVERALNALPDDVDPTLRRRLMLLQIERLTDLGRIEEADEATALLPDEPEGMEIVDLDELLDGDVDALRTDLRGSEEPLSEAFDGALLDLDGVTYHGSTVQPGGPEALEACRDAGMKLGFMTNNAARTPAQVAEKLTSMGYEAYADEVMTSGTDLMIDLKEALPQGAKVLVVGSSGLAELVKEAGFTPVDNAKEPVDAVVQGYGPNVDWALMSEAAYAINAGAAYYATNLDATLPTERGFALGNGALVAAVMRATNQRPISAGKPRPEIFERTAALIEAEKPIGVGDRLETDVAGAINARIASLHVLTGVHSAKDVVKAPKGKRPSFVGLDLNALNEAHPVPLHHRDGTWTCGASQPVKIVRGGVIEVAETPLSEDGTTVTLALDTYRALLAAAWDYSDDRRGVRCPELVIVPNDDAAGTVTKSNYEIPVKTESDKPEQGVDDGTE